MAFEDPTGFNFSSFSTSSTAKPANPEAAKSASSVWQLLNPANARRAIAGLFEGGKSSQAKQGPNIGFASQAGGSGSATGLAEEDWRVRISLPQDASFFYKQSGDANNIQLILQTTNGVIFPYTPSITVNQIARYSTSSPTHSNYAQVFYGSSDVSEINISGDFTVQNEKEGQYLLAVIYFLRACTKMFFGQGDLAGNPPPIVFLDGYGAHYFPHVPCVITSFSHNMPNDVDYVNVPIIRKDLVGFNLNNKADVAFNFSDAALQPPGTPGRPGAGELAGKTTTFSGQSDEVYNTITNSTRLPTNSTITVTLRPVYSRSNVHDRFDLEKFARGELISDPKTGYGGFL